MSERKQVIICDCGKHWVLNEHGPGAEDWRATFRDPCTGEWAPVTKCEGFYYNFANGPYDTGHDDVMYRHKLSMNTCTCGKVFYAEYQKWTPWDNHHSSPKVWVEFFTPFIREEWTDEKEAALD